MATGTGDKILVIVTKLQTSIESMEARLTSIETAIKSVSTGSAATDPSGIQLSELAAQIDSLQTSVNNVASAMAGNKKTIKAAEEKAAPTTINNGGNNTAATNGAATVTTPTETKKAAAKPTETRVQFWNRKIADPAFKAKYDTPEVNAAREPGKNGVGPLIAALKKFPELNKAFEAEYAAGTTVATPKPEQQKDTF